MTNIITTYIDISDFSNNSDQNRIVETKEYIGS